MVSVVIPNYCHARYLDQRIQSVLNQTYQNFEVIILDDCSTDDSREVIERYRSNEHVSHIVYNDVNSGSTFKQWEKGISLAKGELIWIAESDDKCHDTLLEKLVGQFEQNEELVIAFCKTITFDDKGCEEKQDPLPLPSTQVFNSDIFISKYMSHGNPMINASACVFKKDVALKIDKQYHDYKGAGDRLFWTEICEYGKVAVVNEWLNYMRQHPNNFTKKYNIDGTNQREDKRILDYIYSKRYITPKAYNQIRRDYVKIHIFQMVTDHKLKHELYAYWGSGTMAQCRMKIGAWCQKIWGLFRK